MSFDRQLFREINDIYPEAAAANNLITYEGFVILPHSVRAFVVIIGRFS
jgi:hypothetical protein